MTFRGVDSYSPVSENLILQATDALGQKPDFWGRYFTSTISRGAEYLHRMEAPLLAAHGIRVLPVARQTNRVGGSHDDGVADGQSNGTDLLASFGAPTGDVRIFLDVEGQAPSILSPDYWSGWCLGLTKVSAAFLACIYGLPGDAKTWASLRASLAMGARCAGIWLSRPYYAKSVREPQGWTPGMLAPYRDIAGVPLLLWQYAFPGTTGQAFDRDISAPDAPDGWETTLPMPTS